MTNQENQAPDPLTEMYKDVEYQRLNIEELSATISKLSYHVEQLPTLKQNTLRFLAINIGTLIIVLIMFGFVLTNQSNNRDTLNILRDCTEVGGECYDNNIATVLAAEDSIALKVKCQQEDLILRLFPQGAPELTPDCEIYFREHPNQRTS